MIKHNLKLAWRQLIKYRLQSAVSVVSLAVGFACFALAAMWIKYETTYDAFHKDAERIHFFMWHGNTFSRQVKAENLTQFPEVEEMCNIFCTGKRYIPTTGTEEMLYPREFLLQDSSFIKMFDIRLVEGSSGFMHNPNEVAVSDEFARQMWGDEPALGKELKEKEKEEIRTVTAVFKGWGEHTNFPFDLLSYTPEKPKKAPSITFLKLYKHTDLAALNERIDTTTFTTYDADGKETTWNSGFERYDLVPLTQVRHSTDYYKKYATIRVNHIRLFAIAGGMLILCGLLNYLTMFINRLFIRKREIALRTVLGASGGRLVVQFLTEYGLLLVLALLFGWLTIELSLEWFRTMAELPTDTEYLYRESFLYMGAVLIASLLLSVPVIWYFRRQSLQSSITGVGGLARYNLFRRFSTGMQLFISILCIFCTVVLLKQLHTLRQGDLGFERENRAALLSSGYEEATALRDFLKQQPEVTELITPEDPIFPLRQYGNQKFLAKDFPELDEDMELRSLDITEETCRFYGLTLLQGRWLQEGDKDCLLINETLAKRMGWTDPIGREIPRKGQVIGVVKDFLNESPTMPARPYMLLPERPLSQKKRNQPWQSFHTVIKYHEGTWPGLRDKIMEKSIKEDWLYKGGGGLSFQEEYDLLLKSEDNLQKLLTITTAVCILIALFGVWSMIMLTCEQRRKEIAVRKVHGATVRDILAMFFREYMTLQLVAALMAFPVGYTCMKPWLENYVVQTEISWWIYAGIFLLVALLVALCIGWRVWKTANARPADEICKG